MCICERPTRAPTWACERSSANRSRRISRDRGDRRLISDARSARSSACSRPWSSEPSASRNVEPSSSRGASSEVPRHWSVAARASSNLLDRRPDLCCDLRGRRVAAEIARKLVDGLRDALAELIGVARRADRPRPVPEVVLELTGDRRHHERAERRAPLDVEAVDRPQQGQAGDLHEVVLWLPSSGVAPGYVARQRQIATQERFTGGCIATVCAFEESRLRQQSRR